MLLDEPFAGIDPIAVGDIRDLVRHLKERGIGVLITDHNVRETLEHRRPGLYHLRRPVLFAGTPEALVADVMFGGSIWARSSRVIVICRLHASEQNRRWRIAAKLDLRQGQSW